jgi:MFS family permease
MKMNDTLKPNLRVSMRVQFILFLAATVCMAMAAGIHESIFNNFLSDTFDLSAGARGWLELPRELPGFMVVAMTGVLAALPITRVGMVGGFVFFLGMLGIAFLGGTFAPMVLMMMIASAGLHLIQPISMSIAIAMGNEENRGKRIGQTGAIETAGVVLGTGFVWLFFSKVHPQYQLGFFLAALGGLAAAVFYFAMNLKHLHQPRARLVFHKKYSLYYLLELLFGARKQIFLTFGPWVLIKVYDRPANSIASLLMIAALIGIVFKPLVGSIIDRIGERKVLIFDGFALFFVCLGYGYALRIAPPEMAKWIAGGCFIADNLLFALGSGRAVYVSRIADSPQELTSTLAMGVSINHIISMTIPIVAGFVWLTFGYEQVFLAAAILALIISATATFVPAKRVPSKLVG